jgi:hypothetical protein
LQEKQRKSGKMKSSPSACNAGGDEVQCTGSKSRGCGAYSSWFPTHIIPWGQSINLEVKHAPAREQANAHSINTRKTSTKLEILTWLGFHKASRKKAHENRLKTAQHERQR